MLAFHDINPVAPVHFMIVPKEHVDSLDDAARTRTRRVLGRMMALAGRLAREQGAADGFRTIVNTGRVGRQDVYHLHIHMIGGPDPLRRMIAHEDARAPRPHRRFRMGSFSIWHWLIVLVVVLLIFGTKKLRNMGTDLGGAVKGFKDGMKGGDEAEEAAARSPPPRHRPSRARSRTSRRAERGLPARAAAAPAAACSTSGSPS